jgi:hypothetical protein
VYSRYIGQYYGDTLTCSVFAIYIGQSLTWNAKWMAAVAHCRYVVSELVKIFGGMHEHDSSMATILNALLQQACSSLTQLADFDNNPDLADDTFLLAARALFYSPTIIITPELMPTLLTTALVRNRR